MADALQLTTTHATQARARRRIAGLTHLLSKRPDMFTDGVWPGYFSKAAGASVWDLDGNEYLDMSISAIGATVLGYADPDVDEAVIRAIRSGVSSSLNCPEEVELAELLCELHPWADQVRLTRAGGEAMAVAVRIARAATGREIVAFCGYHGWHDWYLSANLAPDGAHADALDGHLLPGLSPRGIPRGLAGTALPFEFNRLDQLEHLFAEHPGAIACVVMEPIRNIAPEPGFMAGVRALCDKAGAVLVLDEISAGFRLTTGGAHMHLYEEHPDIAVFSKALGNGYAISAVIGRESVMQATQTTFISSTNWTERVGPAAALATLAKHRQLDVATRLAALGKQVQEGWSRLGAKHGLAVHAGGMFPMGHFSIDTPDFPSLKAFFIQEMLHQGILASNLYYAMHAHTDEHVARYLDAVDAVFGKMADAMKNGTLVGKLQGKPSTVGFKRLN